MTSRKRDICGAPWCKELTAWARGQHARHIGGTEICRQCYQHYWEQARKTGRSMIEILQSSTGPRCRRIPKRRSVCARLGCLTELPARATNQKRRRVGRRIICRNCYQATWELAKKLGLSIIEAWAILPEKVCARPC